MIALIVLFLVPIYYIARSKGYNAVVICVVSGLIVVATPFVLFFLRGAFSLPVVDIAVPLAALAVVWLLPARKGSPGKAYLKITFRCPECRQYIIFGREREGCAELCPKCGEVVTVPTDQFSPQSHERARVRPEVTEGEVCFEDFARQEDAVQMQTALEAQGIAARIVSSDAGGIMGPMAAWQEFQVFIDVKNWDKALDVRKGQHSDAVHSECPLQSPPG